MRATERQRNAPSEGVIVERLRTEATNWINAVALNQDASTDASTSGTPTTWNSKLLNVTCTSSC